MLAKILHQGTQKVWPDLVLWETFQYLERYDVMTRKGLSVESVRWQMNDDVSVTVTTGARRVRVWTESRQYDSTTPASCRYHRPEGE